MLYLKKITVFLIFIFYGLLVQFCQNSILTVLFSFVFSLFAYFLVLRDRKEQQLKQDSFIDELIHDIKTPVAAKLRITDLLLKGTFGKLSDSQQEVIMQVNNSSRYVLDLINNVNINCAYMHDNIDWSFETFDLNLLVKECINDLKYTASDKRCTILFDFDEPELFVTASKLQITRVLLNLLANAVKYSFPDRVITVITKKEHDKSSFAVISYGENVPEHILDNVIEKYSSFSKTGTGLGLYICDLILKKHNCKMLIKSDRKTGNYFGFKLRSASLGVVLDKKN